MSKKLFYYSSEIVLQDVPGEISLAIGISGCNIKCKGCHSAFAWNSTFGKELTDEVLTNLILKNEHTSCILFYGGEWASERLIQLCNICKQHGKKICLYTGLEYEKINKKILKYLSFLKTGPYIKQKGSLRFKSTNQKFYKMPNKQNIASIFFKN